MGQRDGSFSLNFSLVLSVVNVGGCVRCHCCHTLGQFCEDRKMSHIGKFAYEQPHSISPVIVR